jgi:hypothetical protein
VDSIKIVLGGLIRVNAERAGAQLLSASLALVTTKGASNLKSWMICLSRRLSGLNPNVHANSLWSNVQVIFYTRQ